MSVILPAYAKLNPALRVLGTENGLHILDTVILPIEFGDVVCVKKRNDKNVRVRFTDDRRIVGNTAESMAVRLVQSFGCGGVDVEIEKKIPIGAGLGGSSADAAAVAKAMVSLYSLPEPSEEVFRSVGSDVKAQYLSSPSRVVGTGGAAVKIENFPKFHVAVLYGEKASMTKEVFRRYDEAGGEDGDVERYLDAVQNGLDGQPFNALTRAAAIEKEAVIRKIFADAGFGAVAMTGSGAAFAAYSREEIEPFRAEQLKKDAEANGLRLILTKTL